MVVGLSAVVATGCGSNDETKSSTSGTATSADASVRADGSSTVAPITQAIAEDFSKQRSGVKLAVGSSGTGGGFKKFDVNQTDINNASRPIKQSEADAARAAGVEFIELPVAFDGLTVVVNPRNNWVDHLTVAELKSIWEPGSKVSTWSQVRAGWPDKPIKLYGPGADSGTFDYFTEAINGKAAASRSDYTATEDDNLIVQGVSGEEGGLGYFGFAYYQENKNALKSVAIDGGHGPVLPTVESINTGKYAPLSRPVFIYVNRKSADRPEVADFVSFYLDNVPAIAAEVGYIPLPDSAYSLVKERFASRTTGSVFLGRNTVGTTIEDILKLEVAAPSAS